MIATDRGGSVSVTEGFIAQLREGPVHVPDPFRYRGFEDCGALSGELLDRRHPLLAGVNTLVTNRPGYLTTAANGPPALVRFPEGATAGTLDQRTLDRRDGLVVAVTIEPAGGALWVADHSLFVNEMLRHGDNARFMLNTLAWLTEGGGRRRLILVHDGKVWSQMNLGGPMIPPISLDQLANNLPPPSAEMLRALANDAIIAVEDENLFNELLRDRPQHMQLSELRRALITAVVFFLIVVFVMQLFITGRPLMSVPASGRPSVIGGLAVEGAAVGTLAPGSPAPTADLLLRGGTVPRTARTLAQQALWNLSEPPPADAAWLSGEAPRIETELGLWRKWQLRSQIRHVWRIASGQIAPVRQQRQLQRLTSQLAYLAQLHKSGRLRLKWNGLTR
jgi:hypothetical protein